METLRAHNTRGISVLGIIIAIIILAAMGGSMAVLVATNQEARNEQYFKDQSFATAQGGLEVSLGLISTGINPCDPLNWNLAGDSLVGNTIIVTREDGRIYVTGSKGSATTALSIVDPTPPSEGQVLQVDANHAKDASNGAPPRKLTDITFQLAPGCGQVVTITSLVVSWSPNYGESILQVKFDGANVYDAAGVLSGGTIDITNQSITDANVHLIDFIRWDSDIQNRLYTIQFNFLDGSNKVIEVDTR
ncbi:MAG: hypothetical protein COV45_00135 [Deltaproteobacteria bacterium CG11_big_fil_rev_8_21_14_0_20_47_16]|nr:MAG: hypothetical protein COV45_00135 [Deltaproteobacteria bacterium CG11_big_fil_rev_8_21_14_0_20_47_16]